VTAPNKAKPTMKPTALVTTKIRFLKSCSGRIGSAARRSTRTNAIRSRGPMIASATLCGESQAHVVPPRLVKRMIAERPPARSDAPR
jgi:hypothetical protein